MNSRILSIAAVIFPIALMSALAGYRWHAAADSHHHPVAAQGKPDAPRSDSPMFGGTPSRNMVNLIDKNTPVTWDVGDPEKKTPPKNIKWVADLGDKCYAGPVVADGKVFVGTNNKNPRDPKVKGNKAILMAFNEADGKFLWQIAHDFPNHPAFQQAIHEGLCSTPVVEDKRAYYVAPGCEVICADTSGKVLWTYDMMDKLKVVPHHLGTCSPLIVGDLVMVVTGNGVNDEGKLDSPNAPSFVAINKKTGQLAWQSNLPGEDIIEGQFSNPTLAVVNGKKQVIFPGGDAVLYSFEPETGEFIWKCNCNPLRDKKLVSNKVDNTIFSTPVVVGDRLFIGLGQYPGHPSPLRSFGYVLCLDITKKGDVSPKNYDIKDPANKNSALVWAFGGMIDPLPEKGRHQIFGRTISSTAVHDGLVYINEEAGYLHCLDAKTGQRYWDHDFKETIWGSAYCVDNKVYVIPENGDGVIFSHGKERKWYLDGKLRAPDGSKEDRKVSFTMDDLVYGTPVVANGVLYIATAKKLYAISNGK